MKPADRQLLREQCERVHRIIGSDLIADNVAKAIPPKNKGGVLLQPWETD